MLWSYRSVPKGFLPERGVAAEECQVAELGGREPEGVRVGRNGEGVRNEAGSQREDGLSRKAPLTELERVLVPGDTTATPMPSCVVPTRLSPASDLQGRHTNHVTHPERPEPRVKRALKNNK